MIKVAILFEILFRVPTPQGKSRKCYQTWKKVQPYFLSGGWNNIRNCKLLKLARKGGLAEGYCKKKSKALFAHGVFQPIFVGGTFDLFDVMCKHLHWIVLNPFFNRLNNRLKNAICKYTLRSVTF